MVLITRSLMFFNPKGSLGADANYKDIILSIEGVETIGIDHIDTLTQGNFDWLNTSLGDDILG